jgi:hypothetical protein
MLESQGVSIYVVCCHQAPTLATIDAHLRAHCHLFVKQKIYEKTGYLLWLMGEDAPTTKKIFKNSKNYLDVHLDISYTFTKFCKIRYFL